MKGFCKKGRFEMVNQYIHACYRLRLFDFNLKETIDEFINVIKISSIKKITLCRP